MGRANHQIRAVLFDIDNTLVNLFELHQESYANTFEVIFGIAGQIGDIAFSGKTTPNILREVCLLHKLEANFIEGRLALACDYLADLTRAKLTKLDNQIARHILPGAVEILETLRNQKVILGILSGNPGKLGHLVLEMTNLKPYFSLYTFGDEAETRSELARLSLAKLQTITRVSAGEVMIVGDAVADIEAARAVGAVSIAVATGFHSLEELARANPDYLWANLLAVRTDFLLDLVGG